MIQNELDKLKSLIENDGYEVLNENPDDNEKYFVVRVKKDPWEGVEFILCNEGYENTLTKGKIYPILRYDTSGFDGKKEPLVVGDNGDKVFCYREFSDSSTEDAYVDQLKKEAFERFGEIKDGDRFEVFSNGIQHIHLSDKHDFDYDKETDTLTLWGFPLYHSGKWAKKIEKFTVEIFDESLISVPGGVHFGITFKINKHINPTVSATILAQALEKHLNNE